MKQNYFNTFNTQIPKIYFAESTIYPGTKHSKNYLSCSSNIIVIYSGYLGRESRMPLFQIYYNPGQKNWGIWKCPYISNPWEKPRFYHSYHRALEMAKKFYYLEIEEDIKNGLKFEIAAFGKIVWTKNLTPGKKHPEYKIIEEKTIFTADPLILKLI